ncbi:MAG: hypothetical protein MZU97_20610 [Bacillus subtilis]|nr:hypothetical protein [Bacillus subtilis]
MWGALEATVGYLLHFVPTFLAGTIMFPIAAVILAKAHQTTQSKTALLFVGLVAASIKAVNFLFPVLNIWKTINPMIAIVLETLVVFAVISVIEKDKLVSVAGALMLASVAWRVLYVAYQAINGAISGAVPLYLQSVSGLSEFVLFAGLLSGGIAIILYSVVRDYSISPKSVAFKPVFASLLFGLALALTILL